MKIKLPAISGKKAIKAFNKIGYKVVRKKGSHIRLRDNIKQLHKPLTITDHRTLRPGLLRMLIRDANLTVEEFLDLSKD